MINPSPLELFGGVYPRRLRGGKLALHTATLRAGTRHTSWCFNTQEADRLSALYKRTRRVRFGVALHDQKQAEAIAGRELPAGQVRGCEASVSALPALWAYIPCLPDAASTQAAGARLLPGRRQALELFRAARLSPSILISTDDGVYGLWPFHDLWIFDPADAAADRRQARGLLQRVQWDVASRAAERDWPIPAAVDLAADVPLPGFATGDRFKDGPRARIEALPRPGEGRYRRRDFESLPEPPPDVCLLPDVCLPADGPPPPAPNDAEQLDAPAPTPAPAPEDRPRIVISTRQHEVNDQALAALAAAGAVFEHDGMLVEHVTGPDAPAAAAPAIHPIREPRLQELLARHCDFVTVPAGGGEPRAAHPPRWTTRALMARRQWPQLPRLSDTAWARDPAAAAIFVPAVDSAAEAAAADARLLAGLEQVLDALGGTATARRMNRAVAAEPERFAGLVAAFERFAPELTPGEPPATRALGGRLGALKDRVLDGRALVAVRRIREGTVWCVRRFPDDLCAAA